MPITDETIIAELKSKYQLPVDEDGNMETLTVYRSATATNDQISREYLFGEDDTDTQLFGGLHNGQQEIVILGSYSLIDADSVWTEFTGE